MKISVADFSVPIGASVFKFCVHFQISKVYCVNENKDAKAHFAFFFNFSFCHSYNTYGRLYPWYEVYRGYIFFAFSVIMFVCLCFYVFVCL